MSRPTQRSPAPNRARRTGFVGSSTGVPVVAFAVLGFLAAGCAPEEGVDGAQGDAAGVEAEGGAAAEGARMGTADDSAAALADRAVEAMGGWAAWDSARFIAFDWIVDRGETQVRRSHAWDRWEAE